MELRREKQETKKTTKIESLMKYSGGGNTMVRISIWWFGVFDQAQKVSSKLEESIKENDANAIY